MPIYKNSTALKAFKGDYKPVNIYKGTAKIAGWEYAEVNGESLSAYGTYNDDCSLTINGKSIQAVTVQGKNLLDSSYENSFINNNTTISNHVYTTNFANGALYINYSKKIITLTPNKNYRFWLISASGNLSLVPYVYKPDGSILAASYSINGVAYGYVGFTAPSDGKVALCVGGYVTYGTYSLYIMLTDDSVSDPRPYESFVPNMPSPNYPSLINSVNNFNLISTDGVSKTQTINFPYALRSLPNGTKDYIEIDNVAKTAKLIQNIGEIVLTGGTNEIWVIQTTMERTDSITLEVRISDMIYNPLGNIRCSHFKGGAGYYIPNAIYGAYQNFLYFCVPKTIATDTATFKTWLATHNITVQYKLASPVETPLDFMSVKTYYPNTLIYSDSLIKPNLTATFKK